MANRLIATWAAGGLVVGAVATGIVAASGAGGTGLRRLPIGAAANSAGGATAAGALDAATSEGSASTKIAAGSDAIEPGIARVYRTEFEVSDGLPVLDGDAVVWQLRRSAVKSSQVSDLAAVFSVTGDPVKAADYDAWLLGPNDGTKPMLSVDGGAGHHWYFSDPGAFPVYAECTVAEPATSAPASGAAEDDKSVTIAAPDQCPTPEPPANLPGRDQALALAKELAAKVGLGSADLKWETFGDEWSSGATAQLMLDGVSTEESWLQVSFGGDSKVQWASGLLDMPSKVGEYPRIGTAAAVEQLRAMTSGIGDKGVMPLATDAVSAREDSSSQAVPAGTVSEGPATDVPVTTECGPAVDCPAVGDDPNGPVEEVVQTVKLNAVSAGLSSYYGSDEVLYLVPSYRFSADDGSIWPVIALDDKYLAADDAVSSGDNTGGGTSGSSGSGVAVTGGAPAPRVAVEPATTPAK